MKTALTPFLVKFLLDREYQYLLSKTQNVSQPGIDVQITLTPVVARPQLRRLPRCFDTYIRLGSKEAGIMANGIDGTLIVVSLCPEDVSKLKERVLNEYTEQRRRYA
ncbi:MAG: hypothetical protein K0S09_2164 [Sphingobacteriaceae bacterium]|jgi:hypothetical protein|nr:hypothetical protein [Sphingobacteriaceae bacterium]